MREKQKNKQKKIFSLKLIQAFRGVLPPCQRIAFRITSVISFTPKTSTPPPPPRSGGHFTGSQEGGPHTCVVFGCVPQAGSCLLFPTLIEDNVQIQLRKAPPAISVPHYSSFEAISRLIPPLSRDHSQSPDHPLTRSQYLARNRGP